MSRAWSTITAAILTTLAMSSTPVKALEPSEQRGLHFVEAHCAKCHAIGRVGASPLASAPAFRTLHTRYAIDDLAESFAEGVRTGHSAMPEWQLHPDQISDLIDYLKIVQD